MLSKSDVMSILVNLENNGLDINQYMRKLLVSKDIPIEVLRFISQNKGIEVANFYEMLRKKHNQNKSPLYTNILKEKYAEEDATTTLACLLVQIILYNNRLENKGNFLKEVRANEISNALNEYFTNGNLDQVIAVLKCIKTDILVLEYFAGRREAE